MCVADELRHDGDAAEHEDAVEDALTDSAEVEQRGERPGAGEGRAEHFGADQDGGADDGDDVEPDDAASCSHDVFLSSWPQSTRIRLMNQARRMVRRL